MEFSQLSEMRTIIPETIKVMALTATATNNYSKFYYPEFKEVPYLLD